MGKWLLFIFFSLNLIDSVYAENVIQVTGVSYASNYELGDGTTKPVIYGGIVGADCGVTGATTFCNNCTTADQACNRKRIHPNLLLRIDFKVTGDISGNIHFGYDNSGTGTEFGTYNRSTDGTIAKDGTGYVEIYWGYICDTVGVTGCSWASDQLGNSVEAYISVESGTASFPTDKRVAITIDVLGDLGSGGDSSAVHELTCSSVSPNAGICGMYVYPGDQKVYISNLVIQNTCPDSFKHARIFYSTTSLAEATYTSANYKDLEFDTNCEPKGDWIVDGLDNDIPYAFRASILDVANNNFFLTSDDAEINVAEAACATTPLDATADANCSHIATPGEVVGLLPEDFNCFIATAAYGTGFAPKINVFRKFRNQFLLTNSIGRKLVEYYYEYGPKGAKFISDKPALRAVTRAVLMPFWGFAWLSLHYGFFGVILLVVVGLTSFIFYIRRSRRRWA